MAVTLRDGLEKDANLAGLAMKGLSLGGRAARFASRSPKAFGAIAGSVGGSVLGGVQGASQSRGQTMGRRVKSTLLGVAKGGVMGGTVGGTVGAGISRGARFLGSRGAAAQPKLITQRTPKPPTVQRPVAPKSVDASMFSPPIPKQGSVAAYGSVERVASAYLSAMGKIVEISAF